MNRTRFFTLLSALVLLVGCGRPPQIGTNEHVFNTVDALYTAVCSQRSDLVDNCDRELESLRSSGDLPAAAHARLKIVIEQTRQGKWRPAAESLSRFMEGQRGAS